MDVTSITDPCPSESVRVIFSKEHSVNVKCEGLEIEKRGEDVSVMVCIDVFEVQDREEFEEREKRGVENSTPGLDAMITPFRYTHPLPVTEMNVSECVTITVKSDRSIEQSPMVMKGEVEV